MSDPILKTENGDDWMPHAGDQGMDFPPALTLSSIVMGGMHTYMQGKHDEAIRHARENAMAMRRDCWLMALVRERAAETCKKKWRIKVDNPRDPFQKMAADGITKMLESYPFFRRMLRVWLSSGLWYGRQGNHLDYRWSEIKIPTPVSSGPGMMGSTPAMAEMKVRYLRPRKWLPINGDKINYDVKTGEPCVQILPTALSDFPEYMHTRTNESPAIKLRGALRERVQIFQADPEDADYWDGEMAGGIHGVGIRHWTYWHEYMRKEYLAWITDTLERYGLAIVVIYFDPQNADSVAAADKIAKGYSRRMAVKIPRANDGKMQNGAIEVIEMPMGSIQFAQMIIGNIEGKMERFIVGQSMSSGNTTDGSSLGDTGRAEFASSTKADLIQMDSDDLGEFATGSDDAPGLVSVLRKWVFPWADFPLKFELLDADEAGKAQKLEKLLTLANYAPVPADDAYELAGTRQPMPGELTIGGMAMAPTDEPPPDEDEGDGFEDDDELEPGDDPSEMRNPRTGERYRGDQWHDEDDDEDDGPEQYGEPTSPTMPTGGGAMQPAAAPAKPAAPEGWEFREAKGKHKAHWFHAETGYRRAGTAEKAPKPFTPEQLASIKRPTILSMPHRPDDRTEVERRWGQMFPNTPFDPEHLTKLIGAPTGAIGQIQLGGDGGIGVTADSPRHGPVRFMSRTIRPTKDGGVELSNNSFFLRKGFQGGGYGSDVLSRSVQAAHDLGISKISTYAGKGSGMNGYYTWPRLGYDAPLADHLRNRLAKELPQLAGAKNISDVMATPEGQAWWKRRGEDGPMSIDLESDSPHLKRMNEYMQSKGKAGLQLNAEARQKAYTPGMRAFRDFAGSMRGATVGELGNARSVAELHMRENGLDANDPQAWKTAYGAAKAGMEQQRIQQAEARRQAIEQSHIDARTRWGGRFERGQTLEGQPDIARHEQIARHLAQHAGYASQEPQVVADNAWLDAAIGHNPNANMSTGARRAYDQFRAQESQTQGVSIAQLLGGASKDEPLIAKPAKASALEDLAEQYEADPDFERQHPRDKGKFSSKPGAKGEDKETSSPLPKGEGGEGHGEAKPKSADTPAKTGGEGDATDSEQIGLDLANFPETEEGVKSFMDRLKSAAGSVGKMAETIEHAVANLVKPILDKIPAAIRKPVVLGLKAAFATYTAGQALAHKVAMAQGLSEEEAKAKVATLAKLDILASKGAMAAGSAVAGPVGGTVASFVPVASMGYIVSALVKAAAGKAAKPLEAIAKAIASAHASAGEGMVRYEEDLPLPEDVDALYQKFRTALEQTL